MLADPAVFCLLALFSIYLAVLGLGCGMGDLGYSMWDLLPSPGLELRPLHWEHRVLATAPPGPAVLTVSLARAEAAICS